MSKYDNLSPQELNQIDIIEVPIEDRNDYYKAMTAAGKKWCYDCKNYYEDCFCSYRASSCYIYGSLDVDQCERHPDITANSCPDYKRKNSKSWYGDR